MWILVVPTNCSKQWEDQPSDSLVRWRIFMTSSPILPCPYCYWISYGLDRKESQTHKNDIEERGTKYLLKNHCFHQSGRGRYWIVGLFWKLHLLFTPLENLQEKEIEGREEGYMNCLVMIAELHIGQVLYKMPVPWGDNKLKQMHIIRTGKTCRRTSSLHCTFVKKYKLCPKPLYQGFR